MITKVLRLAEAGFYIFPLVPNSKLPAVKGWPEKATRDTETLKAWWSKHPDCNIGICCTQFGDDRALLVVDVDNKNGKSGDETILELEMEGKEFPPTLVQITPSGGRHLIYVVDKATSNSVEKIGKGLDIRSHNGFIVGPGSVVESGTYKFSAK